MKTIFSLLAALSLPLLAINAQQNQGYPINPVPFTSVKVTPSTFWGQRLEASRNVTIPLAFSKCEESKRYANFSNAAIHLKDPSKVFEIKKGTFPFDDTDPYKTIEGASYILQTYPDKKLAAYIDSVLNVIASAQEPDGYLYTARTQNPQHPHDWSGMTRWSSEEQGSHELYNLGHMVEGAVAHYQATGSRKFLDIAIRFADLVCKEVGPNPGQACVVPGHQIAEMALARLYLATGDKKYLDEAKFLLDYRGKTKVKQEYSQSHKPVVEQDEAVGHAVRAAYMYAGMADVAALTGDKDYIRAIDAIWDNIVTKKLYITGGIGATGNGEAFGKNYELPNMTAYCETCAAIGNVYVNHRLFLLHGESKYYDVLERTLYNGLLSGVSLEGNGFFYPNPLESEGQHERQPWFGCACCPSNICRFIPSLPGYVYAVKEKAINNTPAVYVNLFLSNTSTLNVGGKKVRLSQTTDYPWNGDITLKIEENKAGEFWLNIRLPGWVYNQVVPSDLYTYADGKKPKFNVSVNDFQHQFFPSNIESANGYIAMGGKWKKGDVIKIHFDMEPRIIRANENVEADRGMLCVERGPLVYCIEHLDNTINIKEAKISTDTQFKTGKTKIAGTPVTTLITKDTGLTLIPYYSWCHRGKGNMRVWIPEKK
ncbi:MAG: glycoside hydrolase family 127 protein [Bacteroidaceae bacterium]|nr:glycoside hydrolase family 127 protein [Bacteroidaceae bacterium]